MTDFSLKRLILSRKGFDSGSGGMASPILDDGRLVLFPIPEGRQPAKHGLRYRDILGEPLMAKLVLPSVIKRSRHQRHSKSPQAFHLGRQM